MWCKQKRLHIQPPGPMVSLTGHVKHCVSVVGALLESLDGFGGRQDQQFNLAPLGLLFDFFHHWKPAVRAGSDHEALTFPGYLFLDGQRRVAELIAELLGGFLLAFENFPAIDHNVVLVGATDLERTERKFVETHTRTPWTLASGALVRRDSGEGGPALLNVLAAAVRTQDFALFVVGE